MPTVSDYCNHDPVTVKREYSLSSSGSLAGVLSFDDVLDYVQDEVSDLARLIGREQRHERRAHP